jgi:hypothetical protein
VTRSRTLTVFTSFSIVATAALLLIATSQQTPGVTRSANVKLDLALQTLAAEGSARQVRVIVGSG